MSAPNSPATASKVKKASTPSSQPQQTQPVANSNLQGEYEGLLYKKATSLTAYLPWAGWRSRYCVADNERLRYYGRKGDPTPRGVIEFAHDCKIVRKGKLEEDNLFGFDIIFKGNPISFASTIEKDINLWTEVLELKVRRASLLKTNLRSRLSKIDYETDETDDFDTEDEAETSRAMHGTAPEGFQLLRVTRMSPEVCNSHDSFNLVQLGHSVRIFELKQEFAGNSSTDINSHINDWFGATELKAHASVCVDPAHLFAMMMDLSSARKEWDPSFASGKIVDDIDAHNDVVHISLQPFIPFSSGHELQLKRYWCREASGAYLIYYTGDPCIEFMYVTISPCTTTSRQCVITYGIRYNMKDGWKRYLKAFGRAQVARMLSGIENLKSLVSQEPRPGVLSFSSTLQDLFTKQGVDLNDPQSVVSSLRKLVSETRELTPQEQAVVRARELMQEEQKSLLAEKKKSQEPVLTKQQKHKSAPALNYEYGMPSNNFILPMAISKEGVSAWWDSGVEKGYWKVRGPNYLQDRVKIPNETSAMELLQIQWSFYDAPKRNIALDPGELVQLQHVGRNNRPFMLVINFMVPTIGNWVCYYVKRRTVSDAKFDKMLAEFIEGNDEHRNSRFKIIPSVVEGNYLAKRAIGSTPAIIGKKIKTEYFKGDNWFEVCVDVGSSRVAGSLMSVVKKFATSLVIDLAFLLESQSDEELPERLIGGCRMHLPLMYPSKELVKYAKSSQLLQQAYSFPPPPPSEVSAVEAESEDVAGQQEEQDEVAPVVEVPASQKSKPKSTRQGSSSMVLDYDYDIPENNFLAPMNLSKEGKSAWWDSGADIGYWKLRGPNYLHDRVKVPNQISAMEIVQLQLSFYENAKMKRHICADPDELVQRQHAGRKDRPFLFVVNFMVPTVGNWVVYFAKRRNVVDPKFDKMLHDFINGDDEYRNNRFKIIPSVVEGYFILRRTIGSKPALLGRKIPISYYRGENYFEVCVDTGSSSLAEGLLNVVKSYCNSLVLDLAFLVESQTEDELPERLLGGTRNYFPTMYQMPQQAFKEKYYKSNAASGAEQDAGSA